MKPINYVYIENICDSKLNQFRNGLVSDFENMSKKHEKVLANVFDIFLDKYVIDKEPADEHGVKSVYIKKGRFEYSVVQVDDTINEQRFMVRLLKKNHPKVVFFGWLPDPAYLA
ncbi:MAG: hypothetical protein J5934_00030 [Succinivibrio sp.]|nr:hypothetical protein [Succinivibrio sp.]